MAAIKHISAEDQLCIQTLRMLAVDMVEKANSGHPGLPLGAAPMAYVLWRYFRRQHPQVPNWLNRDRFILSAGHGSALLYALLHLSGYDLSMEQLQNFRQWQSQTPGHPEVGHTPGVETTTGPLGQGFATGVGMAIAQQHLAASFNQPDMTLIDHRIYAIVSDGDLMEGVSSEAASLAGHLKLGQLIYLYDDNHISIEGDTQLAFSENIVQRFQAHGWHVLEVADGNDIVTIAAAIEAAQLDPRPSLIKVRTHIGYGSPKQDSAAAHGEPLGSAAMKATREFFQWSHPPFTVPAAAREAMASIKQEGQVAYEAWQKLWQRYQQSHPQLAAELTRRLQGELPHEWQNLLPRFAASNTQGPVSLATRAASGKVLNALASNLPELMGGSADLAPSTKTIIEGSEDFTATRGSGRNLRFGVREHAMGCIANGMALYGAVYPYTSTFFVFSDYMRPAIRLAAIMQTRQLYIFTHDSIGVGEDGSTHQPIEHLASLRAMPGLTVLRPADANETSLAWGVALQRGGPVALVLTRQNLPVLDLHKYPNMSQGVAKGGYVLYQTDETPSMILMASGSEVDLALQSARMLESHDIPVRVVSMPCMTIFAEQSLAYQHEVLPPEINVRLSLEAGASLGWHRYLGAHGHAIAIDHFGASAPGPQLFQHFGFHAEHVVQQAFRLLQKA